MICIEDDKFSKGLTPLESSFSMSDVGKKENASEEESKRKVGDIVSVNIRTSNDPRILKIGAHCSQEEKGKFMDLFCEFKDVFAWSYANICGFDPNVIQHAIPIKEGAKQVIQRQRPVKFALAANIIKEVEKLLKAQIIFPVKYSEWVSNMVPVRKKYGEIRICVDFRSLNRTSVKDKLPLFDMELILQ